MSVERGLIDRTDTRHTDRQPNKQENRETYRQDRQDRTDTQDRQDKYQGRNMYPYPFFGLCIGIPKSSTKNRGRGTYFAFDKHEMLDIKLQKHVKTALQFKPKKQ